MRNEDWHGECFEADCAIGGDSCRCHLRAWDIPSFFIFTLVYAWLIRYNYFMDYKYTGIILSKKDIAEADRIYFIYTLEVGKIKAVGKGVRRPNAKLAGNLEPITLAEIFIAKSRGMGKITGAIPVNNFSGIKNNLDLLTQVFYVFRLLEKIIADQEKDEAVFGLVSDYLENLDKLSDDQGRKAEILTIGFIFKFLDQAGYRLEMGKCVHCEKKLRPENNYFSIIRGGVLCFDCHRVESKRIKINSETIKVIRIFLANKMSNLVKLKIADKDLKNLKLVASESVNWIAQ